MGKAVRFLVNGQQLPEKITGMNRLRIRYHAYEMATKK